MEKADAEWQFYALFALLSAQRGQDQVAVKWSDYDGTSLYVVQEKGRRKVKLRIEAHPMLKVALDARQVARLKRSPAPSTILARADGTPWEVNAFQKAAGVAIRSAGLEGVVWHGLRATAVSWSADGGATEKMLQAMSGHQTAEMVRRYARGADQRILAGQAVRAIRVPIAPKVAKRREMKG
jgi:integrase